MTAMTSVVSCHVEELEARDEEMFVVVQENREYDIVYDKETKVMYIYSKGSNGYGTMYNNRGMFTLLVDEDGKPKLWNGK